MSSRTVSGSSSWWNGLRSTAQWAVARAAVLAIASMTVS
jgi:hypothetical protein